MKRLLVLIWLLGITAGLPIKWVVVRTITEARPNITITDVSDEVYLKAGNLKLRLHVIDAPKRRQMCTNAEVKNFACGKRAIDWLL